jgi:tRNA 5-methylaminomethyl-2-thiouridine biosynthesis bifunctional protein
MPQTPERPPTSSDDVALWTEAGPPRSRRHGDVYHSAEDGLAEARAVFLEGCGLPGAWQGRRTFCVGELGLGAGLNMVALLDLWRRTRPPGGHLQIFSVEYDPLRASEAARALAAWPEVGEIAAQLTAQWPSAARGFHRLAFPDLHATLDVAVMEAKTALEAWDGRADAWFLDGFSPALDPELWREETLVLVAARSAPGARAATYTVAGSVRRSLIHAGFTLARRPGYGRKRERLEARLAAEAAPETDPPTVAIIGAGIAGASLARAFRGLGVDPRVFEAQRPGAGASGGPVALAAPRLDAGLGPMAALFAQGARRALDLYRGVPGAVLQEGALQLATGPKDAQRFAAIAGADLFAPGRMTSLDPEAAGARVGEAAPVALAIQDAAVVDPAAILAAWLGAVEPRAVARLEPEDGRWRLIDAEGAEMAVADRVCIAAGPASAGLIPGLPLTAVRGQADFARGVQAPGALSFGGYCLPGPGGTLFGATHDRGDEALEARATDTDRNLAGVATVLPGLAAQLRAAETFAWAAIRATTADYLPLAGAWDEGCFVLTGLGSRGFGLAPLLGEHLAASVLGGPSPLPRDLAALVDPGRFAARAARRGRSGADKGADRGAKI